MVSVCSRLNYLFILTYFLSKVVVGEEVTDVHLQPNLSTEDGPSVREEISHRLEKSSEHQTDPVEGRILLIKLFSKANPELSTKEWSKDEDKPWPRLGRREEDLSSGWDLISTLTNPEGRKRRPKPKPKPTPPPTPPPPPPTAAHTRKPIEDIPIIGSLFSLGAAVGLAGQRGATLLADGGRKLSDLARGTLTKSEFQLPKPAAATSGLAHAIDGVSGLTRDELGAVVSAVSNSNGRTDFVKQLLEKSNPESAYRIGLAAASVHGLKSNPVFGSTLGFLQHFVGGKR